MFKDGMSCSTGSSCNMHPKALILAGAAIIIFDLLAMHGSTSTLPLWLSIVVGAALIYAGVTGKCFLSCAIRKYCEKDKGPTDTTMPMP